MCQSMVKIWSTRRQLDAGDDRRGGGARLCVSGDQINGGEQLRDAGSEPRRLVEKVELGEAGNNAGDDLGGRRSSGKDELVARRHGEERAGVLRAPASALKMMTCSVANQRGCGHDGDVRWRRRVRPSLLRSLRCSRRQTERMGR